MKRLVMRRQRMGEAEVGGDVAWRKNKAVGETAEWRR